MVFKNPKPQRLPATILRCALEPRWPWATSWADDVHQLHVVVERGVRRDFLHLPIFVTLEGGLPLVVAQGRWLHEAALLAHLHALDGIPHARRHAAVHVNGGLDVALPRGLALTSDVGGVVDGALEAVDVGRVPQPDAGRVLRRAVPRACRIGARHQPLVLHLKWGRCLLLGPRRAACSGQRPCQDSPPPEERRAGVELPRRGLPPCLAAGRHPRQHGRAEHLRERQRQERRAGRACSPRGAMAPQAGRGQLRQS
mmetsp:Transcript_22506/g.52972  ORF Transcript_22506/g.52972 Transcript_22506/m.52972 type:complete len:255 (-) Transcript_22506:87-851(-)